MPTQCLGRLVKDSHGVGLLTFEDGSVFHVPFRCESMTRDGDLCSLCCEKERKTIEKVRGITGTTIKGMLPSFLNGRVTEPIPFWSRLYDGAWFRLKLSSGCKVSKDIMVRVKKAVAVAYEGVQTVDPQPMPSGRKIKTKKATAATNPVEAVVPEAVAPVAVAPAIVAPKSLIRKRAEKGVKGAEAVAKINPEVVPVEKVHEIKVRMIDLDGRNLYLDPLKEKLYDLKFKYLGRLRDGAIVSFPDSDADL